MRVVVEPAGRARDTDQVQNVDGPSAGGGAADVSVQPDGLGDLGADGHAGVQRGERVLEDHSDAGAADLPHPVVVEGEQVLAVETNGAVDDPAAGR